MPRSSLFLLPLVFAAFTLVAGCSGDEGSTDSAATTGGAPGTGGKGSGSGGTSAVSSGPVARADLATRLADAYCTGTATCCSDAGFPQDGAKCRETFREALEPGFAELDTLQVKYNPERAGECVTAFQALYSTCGLGGRVANAAFAERCKGYYDGLVANGGTCTRYEECAGESFCHREMLTDGTYAPTGVCEPLLRGSLGDACDRSCDRTGTRCVLAKDAPAGVDTPCQEADGLRCVEGTCQPVGQAGDACTLLGCAEGLYCETSFSQGTCTAQVAAGDECASLSEGACAEGTSCGPQGTCEAPLDAGASCARDSDCKSDHCDDAKGTCAVNGVTENGCAGIAD